MSAEEEIEVPPMLGEGDPPEQVEEVQDENLDETMEENPEDAKENEDEDEDEDSDDDVVVTIGDIKPNVPTTKRGFQVQKLDPNVTPTVNGKNIFDVNPNEFDEKPWLKSGANIADYFNFGFTEETWNEYAEKQRLLRLEYPTQAEVNKIIMDELKDRHGNKELHIPVVMPVYNTGGRNLVTVQNLDKPPVKIGFDNPPPQQQQNQPIMRTVLTQSTTGTAPQNIGTINLTGTGSSQSSAQPEKIVVDLTKPPPNFNLPPPGQDGDKNESGPPGTFNPNVPPPGVRMPSNMGNFNRPPMNMFNRPPMGNFYNPMGMMGGPGMGQHGRMPLLRNPSNQNGHDEAPPGVGSNRQSVDAPPGLDNFGSYSSGRDRERDRGRDRDRRRDSEGSDEDRRRRRRERDRGGDDRRDRSDRGRERERDRDRDSSRKRRDSPERSSSRRDRDERKRSRDRDERESDRKRRREDKDDRDRHRRRERSPSKTSKNTEDHAGDDRPPGV